MRIIPKKIKKTDYIFALTAIALTLFGIVMISSSSMTISFERYGTNYHYVIRQLGSLLIGLVALFITYQIDYRIWKKNATWLIFIVIILLILVFIPGIGHKIGGSYRWLGIGNSLFQPSEIVKLIFIIYLAAWLEKKDETIKSFLYGFIPFVVLVGIIAFLIMQEPDFGTTSIIVLTSIMMFFVAGANLLHLAIGGGFLAGLFLILVKTAPYRMQRLLVFLNPTADSQGASYHINQALIAIGTGGLWGLGFGQSRQKYLYLPMAHTDSIFAIICEELGFVRTSIVLLVFIFLGIRGFKIAKDAPDNFAKYLAVGITSWILIQTFINIGAMLNLLPMTGVPLPFISYGGSSLIILLAAVGIMLNISKNSGGAA
jgi:cell division protein FtsW